MRRMNRTLALVLALLLTLSALTAAVAQSRTAKIIDRQSGKNLTNKTITLYVGQSKSLDASFSPAIGGKPGWKSSKSKVAKVTSGGKVWGKAPGTATVTVSYGGAKAKVKVTVKRNYVDNITKKPSAAKVRKQAERVWFYLKSAEVKGDGKVVAEYYVGNNSAKRLTSVKNLYIEVSIQDPYYGQPSSGDECLAYGEFKRLSVNVPPNGVGKVKLNLSKCTLPAPKLKGIKKWLYAFFYC